jgi:O-methyltransferase involved in polyketide biosynthesis
MAKDTSRISPTAHYTGSVWRANGLGDARLDAVLQHRPHRFLSPWGFVVRPFLGGATLDTALLRRHLYIDHLVSTAIAAGAQRVIEVPAGFSARGLRFARLHPDVDWMDGDLAHMVELRKQALGADHPAMVVDLLADDGPHALARLPTDVPTVVIVEGLFNYFPTPVIEGMWARIARFLHACPSGWLTGDTALGSHLHNPLVKLFFTTLGGIARGRTAAHYSGPEETREALLKLGFDRVAIHSPRARARELGLPAPDSTDHLAILDCQTGPATDARVGLPSEGP